MFGDFYFPDGTKPDWDSLYCMQKEFMIWFNEERTKTMLTFPVESVTLLYKDDEFVDKDMFTFVAEEYARGHSFFTYISDTVDSLSSCCRLRNKIQTKEFNFTNGNIGIQTGSKSVITLNLNRIIQDWYRQFFSKNTDVQIINYHIKESFILNSLEKDFKDYLIGILERIYRYHTAYNELLWDMYDANLLPAYKAGFINLDKQYLTIGINGLNQAAEFLGIKCTDNKDYSYFCKTIFSIIKEQNNLHNTSGKHKLTFNTECVPAESLAVKNYNWDKKDCYWVPEDINLYTSYIFKPNDSHNTIWDRIKLHGNEYIGDYLDGGSACHINLDKHPSIKQAKYFLNYCAKVGCSYFTINVINSECAHCHHIEKINIDKCPVCGSTNIYKYDRIIGYLTRIDKWSDARKLEHDGNESINGRIFDKIND